MDQYVIEIKEFTILFYELLEIIDLIEKHGSDYLKPYAPYLKVIIAKNLQDNALEMKLTNEQREKISKFINNLEMDN